ncbi:MAG: type IX secretion system membrane protein PorP/SprF [Flavobacteriaceae bacterium]|nr:type IX secretion system membrane protein PorP/SprF [Flavobacteriaceae bacterium]
MKKIKCIVFFPMLNFLIQVQKTPPIYSDYFSDNVYPVRPAAAGITIPDPVITLLVQSKNYFNAGIGDTCHLGEFFSYVMVKNIFISARNLYNDDFESLNLGKYLLTIGDCFGDNYTIQFEPSIMTQIIERTSEKFADFNLKNSPKLSFGLIHFFLFIKEHNGKI